MIFLLATALAGPVVLDRVDVLSEDPGTFLDADVAKFGANGTVAGLRFLEQVKPVIGLPGDHAYVGLSLASQSLVLEQRVYRGLGVSGGLQAHAFLPRGLMAGGYGRVGRMRVGLSLNLLSGATWARPDYTTWRVLPGLGIGVGRLR